MDRLRVRCISTRPYLAPNERGYFQIQPQEGEMISLTLGKVYEVVSDKYEFYQLIDDTGEKYLYPKYMFEPIKESQL